MNSEQQRNVGTMVGVLMGLLISLVLSIVGPLRSGHFTVVSMLVSFLCSSIISVLIGIFVPIKSITDGACTAMKISPQKILGRLISAFISDLMYTPLVTFLMVLMNYKRAKMRNHDLNFGHMYLGNLVLSFVIAYFLIVIFLPLIIKLSISILHPQEEDAEEE